MHSSHRCEILFWKDSTFLRSMFSWICNNLLLDVWYLNVFCHIGNRNKCRIGKGLWINAMACETFEHIIPLIAQYRLSILQIQFVSLPESGCLKICIVLFLSRFMNKLAMMFSSSVNVLLVLSHLGVFSKILNQLKFHCCLQP